MFVQQLPQVILNKLPLELWMKIQEINENKWYKKITELKKNLQFSTKYYIERRNYIQNIRTRSVNFCCHDPLFDDYVHYNTIAEIIDIRDEKTIVKMVVLFNDYYFKDLYYPESYSMFMHSKYICKILMFNSDLYEQQNHFHNGFFINLLLK